MFIYEEVFKERPFQQESGKPQNKVHDLLLDIMKIRLPEATTHKLESFSDKGSAIVSLKKEFQQFY